MYQVSFRNNESFLSYEVRLKFCDHADDDNAESITIAKIFKKNRDNKPFFRSVEITFVKMYLYRPRKPYYYYSNLMGACRNKNTTRGHFKIIGLFPYHNSSLFIPKYDIQID